MSLLSIQDLSVSFPTSRGRVKVVDGVSYDIAPGEILGLVGESGSGKSITALTIMRLLSTTAKIETGSIRLGADDLVTLPESQLLDRRGRAMAMIFQEPMTSLNPLFRAGFQIGET